MDVVVNHTGDIDPRSRAAARTRTSRSATATGKFFRRGPVRGREDVPVPRRPRTCRTSRSSCPANRHAKKPEWLNDPLNYHDRGDIDFGSCSQQCFEQGDFFGLDDLFTEKPNVVRGLGEDLRGLGDALQARRLPRRHRAARQRRVLPALGAADPRGGARGRRPRLPDLRRGRSTPTSLDLVAVRPRPRAAERARLPVPGRRRRLRGRRLERDRRREPARRRRLLPPAGRARRRRRRPSSATTTWAARRSQISQHGAGVSGDALLKRTLLGYDLLYLLRGAPVVYYGDEVGMIGSGGDQAAREDMFPTKVADWKTEARVGVAADRERLVVRRARRTRSRRGCARSAKLREDYPALSTGATIVRYAKGKVLVVSRIDAARSARARRRVQRRDTAAQVTGADGRRRRPGRRSSAPPAAIPASSEPRAYDPGGERGGATRRRRRSR